MWSHRTWRNDLPGDPKRYCHFENSRRVSLPVIYGTFIISFIRISSTRRTDNTMTKRLRTKGHTMMCKQYVETYRSSKNRGWTHVFRKDKQFRSHLWYLSYCSCYKPTDKSSARKGSDYDYEKRNIIVVILTQILTKAWLRR